MGCMTIVSVHVVDRDAVRVGSRRWNRRFTGFLCLCTPKWVRENEGSCTRFGVQSNRA